MKASRFVWRRAKPGGPFTSRDLPDDRLRELLHAVRDAADIVFAIISATKIGVENGALHMEKIDSFSRADFQRDTYK